MCNVLVIVLKSCYLFESTYSWVWVFSDLERQGFLMDWMFPDDSQVSVLHFFPCITFTGGFTVQSFHRCFSEPLCSIFICFTFWCWYFTSGRSLNTAGKYSVVVPSTIVLTHQLLHGAIDDELFDHDQNTMFLFWYFSQVYVGLMENGTDQLVGHRK